MVLDTQPPLGASLASRLRSRHAVQMTTTATETLHVLKRLTPTAVFVGLRRPGPEGWRFLRERRLRRLRVPLVVFGDDAAIGIWARRAGVAAFLSVGVGPNGKELTVYQAAARLGLRPDAVRRRIKQGTLSASIAAGSRGGYRILESDISSARLPPRLDSR